MVAVAVELDGEALVWPAAVDVAAARELVRLGKREPGPANGGDEGGLQTAEADGFVALDDAPQLAGAGPVVAASEDSLHGSGIDPVPDGGLMKRAGEIGWIEGGREVDERPRNSRDGDRSPTCAVSPIDRPASLDDHSPGSSVMDSQNFGQ